MYLLKPSLRPWLRRQVSVGARDMGWKTGARTQDTGFYHSNSDCSRGGHWTHKPVSGEEAGVPPMPGAKSQGWDVHLTAQCH